MLLLLLLLLLLSQLLRLLSGIPGRAHAHAHLHVDVLTDVAAAREQWRAASPPQVPGSDGGAARGCSARRQLEERGRAQAICQRLHHFAPVYTSSTIPLRGKHFGHTLKNQV